MLVIVCVISLQPQDSSNNSIKNRRLIAIKREQNKQLKRLPLKNERERGWIRIAEWKWIKSKDRITSRRRRRRRTRKSKARHEMAAGNDVMRGFCLFCCCCFCPFLSTTTTTEEATHNNNNSNSNNNISFTTNINKGAADAASLKLTSLLFYNLQKLLCLARLDLSFGLFLVLLLPVLLLLVPAWGLFFLLSRCFLSNLTMWCFWHVFKCSSTVTLLRLLSACCDWLLIKTKLEAV